MAPEIVEMAECDAQRLPAIETETPNADSASPEHARMGTRAKQNIPPAVRRAVLQRDERRCRVPGCRNATFLDLHHLRPRSEGGSHTPENLVTVCSAHHRALHRGELHSEGGAVQFRLRPLGDARPKPSPPASGVEAKVFSGLCQLGFRTGQVRAVMAELTHRSELAAAPPQQWLREALKRLRSPHAASP